MRYYYFPKATMVVNRNCSRTSDTLVLVARIKQQQQQQQGPQLHVLSTYLRRLVSCLFKGPSGGF